MLQESAIYAEKRIVMTMLCSTSVNQNMPGHIVQGHIVQAFKTSVAQIYIIDNRRMPMLTFEYACMQARVLVCLPGGPWGYL